MKTPEKCKEMQQLMTAKKSPFPSSQRAAVQHLIEKCTAVPWSASRAGRGRDDPRLETKQARQADAPSTKRRRVGPAQIPPTQPSTTRPGIPLSPTLGRADTGRRLGQGCRPLPALRHQPNSSHPWPLPTPEAQSLPERAPRAPGSSPATKKDKSMTSTVMVLRSLQPCRATRNGPGEREWPRQHQRVTSSSSTWVPKTSPSSLPPQGRLQLSPPIAGDAATYGRGVTELTSVWWACLT